MAVEPAPASRYSVRSSATRSLARLDHSGGAALPAGELSGPLVSLAVISYTKLPIPVAP
jgi:hypothetical protein